MAVRLRGIPAGLVVFLVLAGSAVSTEEASPTAAELVPVFSIELVLFVVPALATAFVPDFAPATCDSLVALVPLVT